MAGHPWANQAALVEASWSGQSDKEIAGNAGKCWEMLRNLISMGDGSLSARAPELSVRSLGCVQERTAIWSSVISLLTLVLQHNANET